MYEREKRNNRKVQDVENSVRSEQENHNQIGTGGGATPHKREEGRGIWKNWC